MKNKNQIQNRERIMKPKQKNIKLNFSGKLLEDLSKLWKKSSEPNDFGYWLRDFIKQSLKNGKRKTKR